MTQVMKTYTDIPPMSNIREMTEAKHYYTIPESWYIAISDVVSSTQAVTEGRYKAVCAVATATIAAQLNLMQENDAPFVFGGDGASILIPPEKLEASRKALAGTRQMAREQFNLNMRVGLIPVRDVLEAGHQIRVARLEMSPNFQQAIFNGGGMRYAEQLLKDEDLNQPYLIAEDVESEADFQGVECRWQSIPSTHDENISLLVRAMCNSPADDDRIYQQVLAKIDEIYGDSAIRHPITPANLHLTLNPQKLDIEGRIRHQNVLFRNMIGLLGLSVVGRVVMGLNIGQWKGFKKIFVNATDHEKFDDTLRMMFSGNEQQRQSLIAYLDQQQQNGQLVYGLHISQASIVTCIVYDYFGHQMHLIDGENGGYTLAAQAMKSQLN